MNNFSISFTACIKRTLLAVALVIAPLANAQEVVVMSGFDEVTRWMKSENWWGEEKRSEQLQVPRVLITGISPRWKGNSSELVVADKKELFYRFILPLVMHANEMVLDRRKRMQDISFALESGKAMTAEELESMRDAAQLLRIVDEERAASLEAKDPEWLGIIDTALYRLDIIPAGLVLGQAAYESGYGTSRFASQGNALFGQLWHVALRLTGQCTLRPMDLRRQGPGTRTATQGPGRSSHRRLRLALRQRQGVLPEPELPPGL